jgi:FtsP/CotA-like multicopper oxidase with cupredoxin domain
VLLTEEESADDHGAAPPVDVKFQPAETDVDLGGPDLRTWAYTDRLPGNEIRIRKGGRLRAAVTNKLPADTSIHWHGIAIVNDMDGVPPLTQAPIPAGGRFTYDFVVPDAGTYWYHSHVGTQADRGLYGALIVEDPSAKADYDEETGSGARRLDRRHRHQPGPGAGKPTQDRDETDGPWRARREPDNASRRRRR